MYEDVKYTPAGVRSIPVNDLRTEYRSMMRKATKRLRDLEKGGYAQSQSYRQGMEAASLGFKAATANTSKGIKELRWGVVKLARFLDNPLSTLRGFRARSAQISKTLSEHGYNIPSSQVQQFGRFMEDFRARGQDKILGSDETAAWYSAQMNKYEGDSISPQAMRNAFDRYISSRGKRSRAKARAESLINKRRSETRGNKKRRR